MFNRKFAEHIRVKTIINLKVNYRLKKRLINVTLLEHCEKQNKIEA